MKVTREEFEKAIAGLLPLLRNMAGEVMKRGKVDLCDVDDLMQEALLCTYRSFQRGWELEKREDLDRFIVHVFSRDLRDVRRNRNGKTETQRQQRAVNNLFIGDVLKEAVRKRGKGDTAEALLGTTADGVEAIELRDEIDHLLQQASKEEKVIISLLMEGYTYKEIGKRLGLHQQTIGFKVRKFRKRVENANQ